MRELAASGLVVLTDKGYKPCRRPCARPVQGAEQARFPEEPQLRSCPATRAERTCQAQLKSWRILRKLRCCAWRAGQLAKAIHVLQAREIRGWKRLSGHPLVIGGAGLLQEQ